MLPDLIELAIYFLSLYPTYNELMYGSRLASGGD